jgi:hypothetical protein
MSDHTEEVRYVPSRPDRERVESVGRLRFAISDLSVSGLVIICELDDQPQGNSRPSQSLKITQYVRMSDESMIRLDMDRGMSSFKHGHGRPVSWRRTAGQVLEEVLAIVQADDPEPGEFPWDEYAAAANLRGVSVDSASLRKLHPTVLLSDELARQFEF